MNSQTQSIEARVTVGEALAALKERLSAAGVSESAVKAELLMTGTIGCNRLEWPLHAGQLLDHGQRARLESHAGRLLDGEPVQYILGEASFMGLTLQTDSRALIPRPETEMLVSRALSCERLWARPAPRIADVGTGTGCIAIGLATARPAGRYWATDVSVEALTLARNNCRRHGVLGSVTLHHADLLEGMTARALDAVISNPPYVSSTEWVALPADVRDHEPRLALDGGNHGLELIERLVRQAAQALRSEGWLFLEAGAPQAGRVATLLTAAGFSGVTVTKDLTGRDRIVEGVSP